MSRRISSVFAVVIVFLLGAAAGAGSERAEWNQDAVSRGLDRVVKAANNIRMDLFRGASDEEKDPNRETPSVREVVFRDLSEIQRRAVALHGLVRAGEGYEQTLPLYRHLRSDIENAREDAKHFPEIAQQQAHLDAAREAIRSLDAYYGYAAPAP